MRVLVDDGFSMTRPTGIGRYTTYLLKALQTGAPQVLAHQIKLAGLARLSSRQLRRLMYLGWLATGYPLQHSLAGVDLIHFTNYQAAYWKPGRVRYVVTVHDLTAFLYPETYSRVYIQYLRSAIRHALRIADVILADSESVRAELIQTLDAPAEKIHVGYVGPELTALPEEVAIPRLQRLVPRLGRSPFLLFVGRLERRKNLGPLIRACVELRHAWPDLQLVLAGRPGFGFDAIQAEIENAASHSGAIHILSQCTDDDLRALYSACMLFVFPSLYEGFGIPLLEAMACGAPVLASDIPTNREIGGQAVRIVPPSVEGLFSGIQGLLQSPEARQQLIDRGYRHAARFTLQQTARQLLTAYEQALSP